MSDHSESLLRVLKGIKAHAHKMRGSQLKSRFSPKPAEEVQAPGDDEEADGEHQVTITAGPKHEVMDKSAIHKLLGMR